MMYVATLWSYPQYLRPSPPLHRSRGATQRNSLLPRRFHSPHPSSSPPCGLFGHHVAPLRAVDDINNNGISALSLDLDCVLRMCKFGDTELHIGQQMHHTVNVGAKLRGTYITTLLKPRPKEACGWRANHLVPISPVGILSNSGNPAQHKTQASFDGSQNSPRHICHTYHTFRNYLD